MKLTRDRDFVKVSVIGMRDAKTAEPGTTHAIQVYDSTSDEVWAIVKAAIEDAAEFSEPDLYGRCDDGGRPVLLDPCTAAVLLKYLTETQSYQMGATHTNWNELEKLRQRLERWQDHA